jgi:DNA-binding beta-propeller fold protein YncE
MHTRFIFAISFLATAPLGVCPKGWADEGPAEADPTVEVVIGPAEPVPESPRPDPLNAPFALGFDAAENMYIVEYDGGRVMRLNPAGQLEHLAGDGMAGYADGTALAARFNQLHNVAVLPDGTLFLSDHRNHAVRRYDPATGLVTSFSGNGRPGFEGDDGPIGAARFNEVINVELTPDHEALLVADIRNRRIRRLDLASDRVTTIAGNGEAGVPEDGAVAADSPLVDPRAAVATPDGGVYLLERNGNVLRYVDPEGRIRTVAGTGEKGRQDGPALEAQMDGPKHLTLAPDGTVYIADDNNHLVRHYDPEAATLTTVDLGPYRLNRPHGVTVHNGYLYIADSFHHRIVRKKL